MSSVSVTSSKRENATAELIQEIESIKTMNETLHTFLNHLRMFKTNLGAVHSNCKQLAKVNTQWVDALNNLK